MSSNKFKSVHYIMVSYRMTKILKIIIIFIFTINIPLFGVKGIKDISLLLKSSYVVANFSTGTISNTLHSFNVAVGVEIGLSKLIAIQAELAFVQKGYYTPETSGGGFFGLGKEVRLSYIEIPMWLKFRFSDFYLGPGIFISYSILTELISISTANEFSRLSSFPRNDVISELDFGVGVIIGYQFKVSKKVKILLDVSYLQGLIPVNELNRDSVQLLTSGFYVGVGVSFLLEKSKSISSNKKN